MPTPIGDVGSKSGTKVSEKFGNNKVAYKRSHSAWRAKTAHPLPTALRLFRWLAGAIDEA